MNTGPLWFIGCDGICLSASMVFQEEKTGGCVPPSQELQQRRCDLYFEMTAEIPFSRGGVTKS